MGKMREVTLLIRDAERLKVIIKSQVAEWDQQQKYWYFYDGVISIINPDGSYGHRIKFEKLPLDLPNISLQFQLDMENIDYREMNIFQAYQRLLVFHKAGDHMNIRKLQVNIQERFTLPVSCAVFAFLGSAIGINLQPRVKYNSFSVTLGIILLYDVIKVITNTLIISESISLYCIWLPNIVAIGVGYYLLLKKTFAY